MKLKNKNVLITGGNKGLGFEICKGFLKEGANIIFCGRSMHNLQEAFLKLKKFKTPEQQIYLKKIDISKEDQCDELLNFYFNSFDGIDVLVNNAGVIGPKGKFDQINWNEWKYAIEVNLYGSIYLIYKFLPFLKKNNSGSIIQLSGGGATSPFPYISAYAASKCGIVRFIESLAIELRDYNIKANCIAPGPLNTSMLDEYLEAGAKNIGLDFYKKVKLQKERGGAPIEKAVNLAIYLACEESPFITGKLISALWDDWENIDLFLQELSNSDVYTLRRIIAKDRNFNWGDL